MKLNKLAKSLVDTIVGVAGCAFIVLLFGGIVQAFTMYPRTSFAILCSVVFCTFWASNYYDGGDD